MSLLAVILGWAVAVVVNALADTLPFSRRVQPPACEGCGAPRSASVWSGLLALALGRTACPYCARRRRTRAPFAEAVLAGVAGWLWWRDPRLAAFLPAFVVASFYLLIVIIDLEHRLILHPVSLSAALVIGLLGALDTSRGLAKTLWGGVAGFAIFLILYWFGELFARVLTRLRRLPLREVTFGFGDVMFAGVIGLTVGWPGVVLALFLGILGAGAFSLVYLLVMLARRRYAAFTPIPYGPFLALGASLVYFGGGALFQGALGP